MGGIEGVERDGSARVGRSEVGEDVGDHVGWGVGVCSDCALG